MQPAISLVMPLFNTARYVYASVESLLAQSFPNFELLVIDDGSTDGSPEIVETIRDDRIRLFRRVDQSGPAAARNRGIAEARGHSIGFFDSDDLAAPSLLAELFAFLTKHPAYRIVCAWHEAIDETGCPLAPAGLYADRPEKLASTMLFHNCLSTSSLLMDRRCLDEERFDETLAVASDYDLWARLAVSHPAFVLPHPLVRYRVHPQNLSHRKQQFTAACLERIFRRQIIRLGLEPTEDELRLHRGLNSLTVGTSSELVLAAEDWLLKLADANTHTRIYPEQPFREVLGERWLHVCHSACGNGVWTWRRFCASPLTRWLALTLRQRYDLLRLSVRGSVKSLILGQTSS